MSEKRNGGPAFPTERMEMVSLCSVYGPPEEVLRRVEYPGVSVRDYFAAHAPEEPWPWFEPVMPPRPEVKWPKTGEKTGDPENLDEVIAWDRARDQAIYQQWPYAWADSQIKERDR